MSFQEIKLPSFIISELFKDALVDSIIDTNENVKEKRVLTEQFYIKSLGENKKNISIVVADIDAVYLSDDKLELLGKLLTACKLNIADVVIVNTASVPIKFSEIKDKFKPEFLLLFGVDIKQFEMPIIFPEYRIQNYDNCKIVISTDLKNLLGNSTQTQVEKRKLWECLKQMFNV